MVPWLKVIHMAAIAFWAAGLLGLPGLYVQRERLAGPAQLLALQRVVRFIYVSILSPAAFIAVASGTALIFAERVFMPWLSLKLAFVGALVILHIHTGIVIVRLFRKGERYPIWRYIVTVAVTLGLILMILYLVLMKPHLDVSSGLPSEFREPGALQSLIQKLNPWTTP